MVIAPGETLTVPQTSVDFEWVIHGPSGLAQTQLIFGSAPFTQTFVALEDAMHLRDAEQRIDTLLNPLEVAQAVLQDLHQASAVQGVTASNTYALDVNAWASLSFIYQVV